MSIAPPSPMGGLSVGGGTANAQEALKHLATAFGFFLLGLIALLINSDRLATGGYRDLRVVAGVHFLTLGWLSLSIFGALQVFSSVALGGKPLNHKLSSFSRKLWASGVVLFVLGFLTAKAILFATGFLLIGVALFFYTWQIVPILVQAKRGQMTRFLVGVAFISIWCVWLLGASGGLARLGYMPSWLILPPGYFPAHLLLALFGWVGSMVIGVGSHLVPMFALSRGNSSLPIKALLPIWMLIPITGVLCAFFPNPWTQVGWALAAIGSFIWAIQFYLYLKTRLRKEKDTGIHIASLATLFLLLAWISSFFLSDPMPFVAFILVGWLCFFTLGIYHRVCPFLVWFVKYSRPEKGKIPPKVKDLTDPKIGLITESLVASGVLLWTIGLGFKSAILLYIGSALMLIGTFCALIQIKTLFHPKRKEGLPSWILQKNS